MKTESKLQWLIWIVVVLAILNISTLATILYRKFNQEKRTEKVPHERTDAMRDSDRFSGRFFRERLKLDSEQMDKFREINPVFRQNARSITMDLARIRREMHLELISEKSDTNRLNLLSDSVGMLHRDLKRLSYHYYLDIKAICTPEQRGHLEVIFRDAFFNDLPMRGPGPPWQRGKQSGKRSEKVN